MTRPEPPKPDDFTPGELLTARLVNAVEDASKAFVSFGAALLKSQQRGLVEREAAAQRRRQRLQECQDTLRRESGTGR